MRQNKMQQTAINVNKSYKGERIEEKISRLVNNKEPISDNAPLVYTERKDGVMAEYNIRTDRFELAIEKMDVVSKASRAKREGKPKTTGEQAVENMKKEGEKPPANAGNGTEGVGGTESSQAT